jgi:peptide/nickel transport system permease protein
MVALTWIFLLILLAIFAPLITWHDPLSQNLLHTFAGPSWRHPLGTDDLGRDVLSRLVYGARVSLQVSFEVVGIALALAIPIGIYSGYRGGQVDNVLMRFMDAGLSFPPLVLALAIAGVLGAGLNNAILAISAVFVPSFVRLIRGQTLAIREEPFIEASRSLGTPTLEIALRRVLPNVLSALMVQISLSLGGALLAEAALSFLGLGVQPPEPSWGSMLQEAYNTGLFSHPWSLVIPGVAIALTVLAFNALADALAAVLHGPGLKRNRLHRGALRARGLTVVPTPRSDPDPEEVPAESPVGRSVRLVSSIAESPVLAIDNLCVEVATADGPVSVVEGVSFEIGVGETLGLVGESGSGKSVTSLAVMRLLSTPPFSIGRGSVRLDGRELLGLGFEEMRQLRGQRMSMIFQDPMASLNPALTIGFQLSEAIRAHDRTSRADAKQRSFELLDRVGIADPAQRLRSYPHQLSGGLRQRVMIAMALSCHPRLLIADEPTTALDVTIQAQILDLLRELAESEGLSVLFVTHDLGVVAEICDSVAVMYAGQIVERATVGELFASPRHPYTEGLIAASRVRAAEDLVAIPGQVPFLGEMPTGCRFHLRCPYALDACETVSPSLEIRSARSARCLRQDALTLRGVGA